MSVDEFWRTTPYQTALFVDARRDVAREQLLTHAWHVAALTRVDRLPALSELLRGPGGRQRIETPEEAVAMVEMLNAAFGGEDRRNLN